MLITIFTILEYHILEFKHVANFELYKFTDLILFLLILEFCLMCVSLNRNSSNIK